MSSVDVRHVFTTKVRPASYIDEPTVNHRRIDLNPWDLLFLRFTYMQRGLLFTKQEGTSTESINNKISHLKTSLSHTLDHFYPLAGRLAIERHKDDNTISVYIDSNFEGVELLHAIADISVEDIVSPTYVPQSLIDLLVPLNGVPNYEGQSHPLLSVQVTELNDGAIFIGCSGNHSAFDGTSFWSFMNLWSEISRSSDNRTSSPPPVFERYFIKETDCPIRLPFSYAEKMLAVRDSSNTVEASPLEKMANSEISSETTIISSLQALLAHVWTAVIRCRSSLSNDYDESRELLVSLSMNNRTKVIPPLPETYSGNSISWGMVTLKEGELLERGFSYLALLLNGVVNSHNTEKCRSFIEWIEEVYIPGSAGDTGIVGNMFIHRSSPWFNMYGNDFGWGRPIAVKTGANGKSYGATTVSPGPVEGSIDIEICLPIEVLEAMENDSQFMDAFLT
ncbi:hypothetical protein MKW94_025256 [Papaver nudicaule]|uniref:Uncharacterized protein n=1 Tax=Papaver nudicaule TaxID=74823 RepID=A0AA41VWB4_PAPNU|nr:hypothetical protein [Papaver nudicaule]